MADIFISYAREDAAVVQKLASALEKAGYSVWWDRDIATGEVYRKKTADELGAARAVLVAWSKDSITSHWVADEATVALNAGRLVPISIDGSMPPLGFGQFQVTDFSRWHGGNDEPLPALNSSLAALVRRFNWDNYKGPKWPGGHQIAFVPFINREGPIATTYKMHEVTLDLDVTPYVLPDEFKSAHFEPPLQDDRTCKLIEWGRNGSKLEIMVSPVLYSDYLRSGEHLDDPFPNDPTRTFRQHFANNIPGPDVNLRKLPLTNICGVGVYVISHDGQILITRHSQDSHVYPGRWTFSASGTMRWGASPNPFTEALWKCRLEANHQVDLSRLELVELGMDARKLFFEFCFVERTQLTASELIKNLLPKTEFELLPFSATDIAERVSTDCWEPAAEATLLALAMQKSGVEKTLGALDRLGKGRSHQMLDEWDFRASRPGNLAVMSVRYPLDKLESESSAYVGRVLQFMGDDLKDRRVLEVGSGVGRITRELAPVCSHVTCVDLCERMNKRNKESLGAGRNKVLFETGFIQGFKAEQPFDVAVCSLVLVHNVEQADFEKAVEVMCRSAKSVFVFEDTSKGLRNSHHTILLSEARLCEAFDRFGFVAERKDHHSLFGDDILFLKFTGVERQRQEEAKAS